MSTVRVPSPPPAGRLRADARRNRERLLDAALAAFTERGSDEVSLEEIARRAGVGIGTLYRHFPTRQALLEAVYRDQVDTVCARAQALAAQSPPAPALAAWLHTLVQFSLTKRIMTTELLAGRQHRDSPAFSGCRAEITAAAAALLARAQQAGQVRPDIDAADLLRLSHAAVAATERLPDRARQADRILQIMLAGVWKPGRSRG
jgi:AcrR family transcriptional regulator